MLPFPTYVFKRILLINRIQNINFPKTFAGTENFASKVYKSLNDSRTEMYLSRA